MRSFTDGPRGPTSYPQAIATDTPITSTAITFSTLDGAELRGDLIAPADLDVAHVAGVVVTHPHPQYGGDRFHPVVDAIARRAATAGLAALRFDFRSDFDDGRGERLDVLAAADRLRAEVADDAPIVLAGYSFGAAMALSATTGESPVDAAALALVAPPFAMFGEPPAPGHGGPTLALVPERDQFGPPDAVRAVVDGWADGIGSSTTVEVVDDADHFLMGAAADVGERVVDWIVTAISR
ncbi:MAG: alpha/beta family hydrolase [Actinomycetota bacterium]